MGLVGCQSAAHEQEYARHEAEVGADRAQARARASLTLSPDTYLRSSGVSFYDEGFVSSVTVSNTSPFAVSGVEGRAVWFDAKGSKVGSTPFALRRSIPSGATAPFAVDDGSLTSGTLHGVAANVVLHFTHLQVVN